MRITRKQIRKLIKEIRDVDIGEWDDARAALDAIYQDLADAKEEAAQYDAIDLLLDKAGVYALEDIRVKKSVVQDALLNHSDPAGILSKLVSDISALVNEFGSRPDGYRWNEVLARMLVEILGIKPAWSRRVKPETRVKRRVNALMKSKLFSKASKRDKGLAYKKIFAAEMDLPENGGDGRYFEEMYDDALGGYDSSLMRRLAAAAGTDSDSWGEALAAWGAGEKDYTRWM